MDTTLYVTLYPTPRHVVNGIVLGIKRDRLDLRLSSELEPLDTVYATVWLDPAPINCHLRIVESSEDPVTGEMRALAQPIGLDLNHTTRLVSASSA